MEEKTKKAIDEIKTPKKKGRPVSNHYVNETDLRTEIKISKEQGKATEKLGKIIQLTVERVGTQHRYRRYTYLADMKAEAAFQSVRGIIKFNLDKVNEAGQKSSSFSYLTQIINNAFKQILKKEKRGRDIKDKAIDAALEDFDGLSIDFESIQKKREKMNLFDDDLYQDSTFK